MRSFLVNLISLLIHFKYVIIILNLTVWRQELFPKKTVSAQFFAKAKNVASVLFLWK